MNPEPKRKSRTAALKITLMEQDLHGFFEVQTELSHLFLNAAIPNSVNIFELELNYWNLSIN